ncbi:MAG: hypothetical protein ACR2P8_12080 [Myxococcota bacterium]
MPERGWRAPLALLALAAASFALYQTAPRAIAELAILPYATCLVFGASFVYPRLRLRGATAGASIAASLLLPCVWLLKEAARVSAVFGPGETLFYAFNPISLGVFAAAAFQMAGWELAVGRARRTPTLVLAGLVGAAAAVWIATGDSGGRDLFYGYIAAYRALFGS